ncbi:MAG TPA: glycerophosphodiester phosphodiesterase [Acidimicrobiia bacterium]|nr:glycerophosphodiester phosphodiesterase [Acidimicrobiia bacterium]
MRILERPWIIAHRGAGLRHRENTLEAFAAAGGLGADAVELDVRRTADGVLVVHHDASVPGFGLLVDHAFDDVRASLAWVPTLSEALAACDPLWVNVEIKNSPFEPDWDPEDTVAATIGALVPHGTLVSSFNPATVERARASGPVRTGYLVFEGMDPADFLDAAVSHDTLHVAVADLPPGKDREIVAAASERGLPVIVYTTDEPDEIERFAAAGVAGVITNAPDVAAAVLS